ncbi:jg20148 [Pararge aegeria aegeria]|uniref:Jg20148 protein n=1 Tax=Pararge aegeria aegeria TaxID=348720 RepID=A0A8S4SFS3_9NEOP|nr:jg20148 [Pararge aegeria aegeria]
MLSTARTERARRGATRVEMRAVHFTVTILETRLTRAPLAVLLQYASGPPQNKTRPQPSGSPSPQAEALYLASTHTWTYIVPYLG